MFLRLGVINSKALGQQLLKESVSPDVALISEES